jgi:DNA-binding NarL/FixJ family response regulator
MTTLTQLDHLTRRERQVLALMAEGKSNGAIGDQLTVGVKTVEAHISRVFTKLGLTEVTGENRRVLAVLAYLSRVEEPSFS